MPHKHVLETVFHECGEDGQQLDPPKGKHICGIFQTEEEFKTRISDFFVEGIRNNEQIIYGWDQAVTDVEKLKELVRDVFKDAHLDLDALLDTKQIQFLKTSNVYTPNGYFSPQETIDTLKRLTTEALEQNYTRLRVVGEMSWALECISGSDRLIEYEALLADFFHNYKCTALCSYDATRFSSSVLLNVLDTHPVVCIGTEEYDNIYFIPPQELLVDDVPASTFRNRVANLKSRKRMQVHLREKTEALIVAKENIEKEVAQREKALVEKETAEKLSKAKSDFLAMMSHEIRTPLNGIICTTNFLSETILTPEQKEYVEVIKVSSDHLMVVLNDVLDWSKIESSKMVLEEKPFSLTKCVKGVMDMFKETEKDIAINCHIPDNTVNHVIGDITRLRQILFNLVSNAIKFTPDGGKVEIQVESFPQPPIDHETESTTTLKFSVRDTGIGIPKDKWDVIFSSFTQVDSSITRRYGGTGLGLTICKRLVELMGGRIWFESVEGAGSVFYFVIHAKYSTLPFNEDFISDSHRTKRKMSDEHRLRILVAEDNVINQKIVLRMFERLGYNNVVLVENGKLAVERVFAEDYDVAFLDLQMPDMDGLEATRVITSYEWKFTNRKRPVIIAMTASAMQNDKVACYQAGMDFHISKPLSIDELRTVLDKLERGKKLKRLTIPMQ